MDSNRLDKWADLLLDTGKRNNLVSFKDIKMGTVEVVVPDLDTLFSKVEHATSLEVYDPQLGDDEESFEDGEVQLDFFDEMQEGVNSQGRKYISKDNYIKAYTNKLKKSNQVLVYSAITNPVTALKNIAKKAKTALEETGVNIAYMAFGFIEWVENENSQYTMKAPILLVPISIENDSVVDPYYIKISDDDIVLNPTFSFKLKNEFGIDLPTYNDEGIEEYLVKIEERVGKLKWNVIRECKIGIFSFLKINMYKDLKENADKVLENDCVRSLLGESPVQSMSVADLSENEADAAFAELNNVVDADSSQMEAIELAKKGVSFVLQGPPGTGKSQTITNIIAECLASGKKVLFVSEKLAALNVVYDKLKKAGLDEFCLELHSHKGNKKDVITELCRTLRIPRSKVSDRAQSEVESKLNAQRELNAYVEELHKIRPVINETLYQLLEKLSACRKAEDVDFVIYGIKNKGENFINEADLALRHFVNYIPSIGYDYRENVWFGYSNTDCSYQFVSQLKENLKNTVYLCENLKSVGEIIKSNYFITLSNMKQAYAARKLFSILKESDFIVPKTLSRASIENVLHSVESMQKLSIEILKNKKELDELFDEDVYKLDGSLFYKKLSKQFRNFFVRLFNRDYRRLIGEIKLCKKDGKRIRYKDAVEAMSVLDNYQHRLQEFISLENGIREFVGAAYCGVNTDFATLLLELRELSDICSNNLDLSYFVGLTPSEFLEKRADFTTIESLFCEKFDKYTEYEKNLYNAFDVSDCDVRSIGLKELEEKYTGCLNSIDKLDSWCEFIKVLNQLDQLGIKSFVDYAINQKLASDTIPLAYKKAFYRQWVDYILHDSPTLSRLSRIPHDEAVKIFAKKDELNFEINKARIKAMLSAMRPNLDMVAQGSAISILLREGEKKRRQKSIRILLDEIGDLAQTLKPCFLMSPLSVSTFLSPDMKFDVVVFDEASQIFPQDAIGTIYRGKQLIVVGDSKQMPPSNFFNSSSTVSDDDDDVEDITDFESILDICSTTFPQKRLKWHYRSRFEELIAFSNKNFYENELITFPSSSQQSIGNGIDYYHVDGFFDRKSKTNLVEAEKVVELVFNNIEKYPERSLGVVAFSMSQQNLIDKLISRRIQQDPTKEEYFKSDSAEPFFVKNLETVQGDERDTIIFSMAYGKDRTGRLLLNFGPINRAGGERRLNVAVTRAKYNVQVVSSMHYTDIDLARTQSVGARLLREYLDYAENGELALERAVSVYQFDQYDSEFEMEVCEFLRENGYSVDTQVGCSSFRIDLALKKPNSSNYLLAIECDGSTYHSSKSSRDRDRLRQEVLERMGWTFYRIWSTDWFRNKRNEQERLLNEVKRVIEKSDTCKEDNCDFDYDSFEEPVETVHFEFPKYQKVDETKILVDYRDNPIGLVYSIVEVETPLSEEWLLKRIVFLFGREKVTNVVRDRFDDLMKGCSAYNIERKNGFLYLKGKEVPMLRVPDNTTASREVKYIALEELANGMMEILRQNIKVEKVGLFRLLLQQLGFTRMGDAIVERLNKALFTINDRITIDGDFLSLKK